MYAHARILKDRLWYAIIYIYKGGICVGVLGCSCAAQTFPTDQRATAYAVVNMGYQITSSIVVPIGGLCVDAVHYAPTPLLIGYGIIQLVLGAFTWFLPLETANRALTDRSGGPDAPGGGGKKGVAPAHEEPAPTGTATEDVVR